MHSVFGAIVLEDSTPWKKTFSPQAFGSKEQDTICILLRPVLGEKYRKF